jgi:hypothetical protein
MYFSLFPFVRLLLSSKKKSMMIKIQIGFKKKNLVGQAGFEPATPSHSFACLGEFFSFEEY